MREKLFAARIKDFNDSDAEKSDTLSAEEKQEVLNDTNCIFLSVSMNNDIRCRSIVIISYYYPYPPSPIPCHIS